MTNTNRGTLALVLAVAGLLALDAHAFRIISKHGHEVRWKDLPVKYYVQENGPRTLIAKGSDDFGTPIAFTEIIRRSFETWKSTTGVDLEYQYAGATEDSTGGDDGRNDLFFVQQGWNDLEFEPPAGALAVTISTYDVSEGAIVDSDIYFNDEYFNWGNLDTDYELSYAGAVDVQNIATHEIGHLFGLDHSSETPGEQIDALYKATMYFSSYAGDITRRVLKKDDENGITHLYPSAAIASDLDTPQIYSITPSEGSNNGAEVRVQIKGRFFGPTTLVRIVGNDMRNDEGCKPVEITPDTIDCYFDLYYVSKGLYDIVVSNSYDKNSTLPKGFTVSGDEFDDNKDSGGCGTMEGGQMSLCLVLLLGMIILIHPIRFWGRYGLVRARAAKD